MKPKTVFIIAGIAALVLSLKLEISTASETINNAAGLPYRARVYDILKELFKAKDKKPGFVKIRLTL